MMRRSRRRSWSLVGIATVGLGAASCDPTLNFYGSFFPAWLLCFLAGVALAIPARVLFAVTRLEPHLGPLLLVYPCLVLLLSCVTWLALFQG